MKGGEMTAATASSASASVEERGALPAAAAARPKGRDWLKHASLQHAVAGLGGGVASTLILHPLDLVKIRFQVQDTNEAAAAASAGSAAAPRYRNTPHAFQTIVRTEGARALYKGLTPNLTGAGMAWGFYFFGYNWMKSAVKGDDQAQHLGAVTHMSLAALAGAFTLVLTNPVWVVKTRMCLDVSGPAGASPAAVGAYRSVGDGLVRLFREEGLRGAYRGFVPGLFGTSHGAVQFMVYEELKHRLFARSAARRGADDDAATAAAAEDRRKKGFEPRLSTLEYLSTAALSKACATAATYPYQVVRSRLQQVPPRYDGSLDVIRKLWRQEGVAGFYRGIFPNLLRVTPATCITFLVYEQLTQVFQNLAVHPVLR